MAKKQVEEKEVKEDTTNDDENKQSNELNMEGFRNTLVEAALNSLSSQINDISANVRLLREALISFHENNNLKIDNMNMRMNDITNVLTELITILEEKNIVDTKEETNKE